MRKNPIIKGAIWKQTRVITRCGLWNSFAACSCSLSFVCIWGKTPARIWMCEFVKKIYIFFFTNSSLWISDNIWQLWKYFVHVWKTFCTQKYNVEKSFFSLLIYVVVHVTDIYAGIFFLQWNFIKSGHKFSYSNELKAQILTQWY